MILTLKIAKQFLHMTLTWLFVAHCHTKFGYKGLSCSEDIIRTNINWYFESLLWPWPWKQQSNLLISSGQTAIDILNLYCDLDLENSNPIFWYFLQIFCLPILSAFLTKHLQALLSGISVQQGDLFQIATACNNYNKKGHNYFLIR